MNADHGRSGGCLCGAVRYEVRGEPQRTGLCHCLDCRKTSGTAYTFFAVFPRSAFKHAGELATFNGRSFCPKCGSRVVHLTDDGAEIMVGSLDDAPTDLVPGYEIWVHRREEWLHKLPWADQYDGDRTDASGNPRQPVDETALEGSDRSDG